jgi:hypothetical protein
MIRKQTVSRAVRLLCGIGLVIAVSAVSERASAQPYYYQCPPGYYYMAGYGCAPLSYYYGPPYYAYPNFSFGFFYGGRHWGGWPRSGYGGRGFYRGGGHPRGGRPHRR